MASILIIDDEPEVGQSLRRVLERAGFHVTTTTSGADALAQFERDSPDVVITDIMMPKVHGIDIIRRIRQTGGTTRIIAISGGGNFGPVGYQPEAITTSAYLEVAKQAGADEILTKPFDREDLLASVRRLLDQRNVLPAR
jgi:two-component system, chemotaxis family, chemotaxis protein CheY